MLGLPGVESYRYDAGGRRTVTDVNCGQRVSIYDHEGRLLEELEPAPQVGCAPANDRVFCSGFEQPPVNAAETRYVYLGRHLVAKDDAQGRHYLHTDALGSLVAETDQSQTVTQRYHYLPFGGAYGVAPDGPGYTGAVMDPSGLVYLQARYYDPQLGRFLSTDPVDPDPQTGANFNRYAYAENNPYSKYDPNGRYVCQGSTEDCDAIAEGVDSLSTAVANPSLSIEQQESLFSARAFYGELGEVNGVTVKPQDPIVLPDSSGGAMTDNGKTSVGILLDTAGDGPNDRTSPAFKDRVAGLLAHEAQHGVEQRVGGMPQNRAEAKAAEVRASTTQAALFQGLDSEFGPWLWTLQGGLQPNGIERSAEASTERWCNARGGCQ